MRLHSPVDDVTDVVEQGVLLVDLERVDAPVGLVERCRVVLDESFAGAGFAGAGTCWPDCAGPVAAEGYVEDLPSGLVRHVLI